MVGSLAELKERVDRPSDASHRIGVVRPEGFAVLEVRDPATNLPVGTLQGFLDGFVRGGGASSIDYVHGTSTVVRLGRERIEILDPAGLRRVAG